MRRPRVVLQENKFLDLHNERKIMSMEGGNQDSNSYIPPAQSPNQAVSRSDNQTPQMKRNRSRKNDADADILRASNQQMTARLSYGPPTGDQNNDPGFLLSDNLSRYNFDKEENLVESFVYASQEKDGDAKLVYSHPSQSGQECQ